MGDLVPGTASAVPPLVWTVPEPGLHRATCGGRIVAHVVHEGGGFIAFDATCRTIGRYETLHAAREFALAGPGAPAAPFARWWAGVLADMRARLARPVRRATWRSTDGQPRSDDSRGFAA